MTFLPSSFTRPRTLSASSSESSASSSSSSSTKSWSEGNFDLTSRGTSNTTSQQHVLLRTQFWEHASASNATTGLRSEKRSHLSNKASSTSLDRRGSTGVRKRRTSEQVVSGSAARSLAVPERGVVQLETPRTRTLTLALSKFSLKDHGIDGRERADEGQAESSQPKAEAEAYRPLKSSLASVSGPLPARSGSIKVRLWVGSRRCSCLPTVRCYRARGNDGSRVHPRKAPHPAEKRHPIVPLLL